MTKNVSRPVVVLLLYYFNHTLVTLPPLILPKYFVLFKNFSLLQYFQQ